MKLLLLQAFSFDEPPARPAKKAKAEEKEPPQYAVGANVILWWCAQEACRKTKRECACRDDARYYNMTVTRVAEDSMTLCALDGPVAPDIAFDDARLLRSEPVRTVVKGVPCV